MPDIHQSQVAFEKYLQAFVKFGTPEEFEKMFRDFGSPDELRTWHATLSRMIAREERWVWFWGGVKRGFLAILAMGGAYMTIADVIPRLLQHLGAG